MTKQNHEFAREVLPATRSAMTYTGDPRPQTATRETKSSSKPGPTELPATCWRWIAGRCCL